MPLHNLWTYGLNQFNQIYIKVTLHFLNIHRLFETLRRLHNIIQQISLKIFKYTNKKKSPRILIFNCNFLKLNDLKLPLGIQVTIYKLFKELLNECFNSQCSIKCIFIFQIKSDNSYL